MVDVRRYIHLVVCILVTTSLAKDVVGQVALAEQDGVQSSDGHIRRALQGTDLDIRYSKIPFVDPALGATLLPLHKKDYPIRGSLLNILKTQTLAASVLDQSDPQVQGNPVIPDPPQPGGNGKGSGKGSDKGCGNKKVITYLEAIGSLPTNPTTDSNDPFWSDFRTVVQYQIARRNGDPSSTLFTLPDIWSSYNLTQVGDAVHNDFPGVQSSLLLKSFVIDQKVQVDHTIIPFRSLNDPLGNQHRNVAINAWVISTIQPITYRIKWYLGRVRPEEIAWLITTDNITAADGVPEDLITTVKSWGLTAATQFTAYPEGCPNHPAWPSGHASVAQNSLWQAVVLNLTDAQLCQARRFDYAYTFARVLVGLHYTTDAYAGLKLGQEVVARKLPGYLSEFYGADEKAVAAKIAKYKFDWEKFVPADCSINP